MAPSTSGAVLDRTDASPPDLDTDFTLDVRVVEGYTPDPALLGSTSNGCGSSCPGACASFTDDPYEPIA
jgi:FxLD family lantipeptide